jgi:hypothetical protein
MTFGGASLLRESSKRWVGLPIKTVATGEVNGVRANTLTHVAEAGFDSSLDDGEASLSSS